VGGKKGSWAAYILSGDGGFVGAHGEKVILFFKRGTIRGMRAKLEGKNASSRGEGD